MKNLFTCICFTLITGAILQSCSTPDNPDDSVVAVNFTSGIKTRTQGTNWVDDDRIGIFVVKNGTSLQATNIVDGADNRQYKATAGASAQLSPVDDNQIIYYPDKGYVDFYAYYPFVPSDRLKDYKYSIDLSVQEDFSKIDLLRAQVNNKDRNSPAVSLVFEHMLSKIIINITEGDGMEDYDFSQVSVSIDGMSVTADLSLADKSLSNLGAVSPISPAVVSPGVSYQAIVLPQGKAAGRSVKFSFSDRDFTWPVPDSDEILAGKEYTWNLTVGKVGVTLSGATIGEWGSGKESNGSAN